MYNPSHFRENDPATLAELMGQYPLASLVTLGPDGLDFSPVPLLYDPTPREGAPQGVLRGHLARANPQWQRFNPDIPALAVFTGPNAYITPNWYPSKQEHGKVAPTWNYAVVEAQGPLHLITEPQALRKLLSALTTQQEATQPRPWQLEDAPEDYLSAQIKAVVGIELAITQLQGKWKMSQNRNERGREGVREHLRNAKNLVQQPSNLIFKIKK